MEVYRRNTSCWLPIDPWEQCSLIAADPQTELELLTEQLWNTRSLLAAIEARRAELMNRIKSDER